MRFLLPLLFLMAAGAAHAAPLFRPVSDPAASAAVTRLKSGTRNNTGEPEPFVVETDSAALAALTRTTGDALVEGIPFADGRTASFLVRRFEVFTPDAQVIETDGKTVRPLPRPDTVFFRGRNPKDPGQSLFLAVPSGAKGEVQGLVMRTGLGATLITPAETAGGTTSRHVVTSRVSETAPPTCGSDELPDTGALVPETAPGDGPASPRRAGTTSPTLEIQVGIDVGYNLYTSRFSSNSTVAAAYATNLLAACSVIYERDLHITLTIPTLVVWTAAEPFQVSGTNSDKLTAYSNWNRNNRGSVNRDLFQYLGYTGSGAGIAWVSGLCSQNYGYGYTNIYGTYTYPTTAFTADVFLFAHEMGHNAGSPHTHCYTPPIDQCYSGEGGCYTGVQVPELGTLMSYCHLSNGTGRVDLTFHPRCISRMRPYAESSSCLAVVPVVMSAFGVE